MYTIRGCEIKILILCENRDVYVSGIFTLAQLSTRMFPTFVMRANIDVDDKEKTQNQDFWSNTISVKQVIVHTQHTEKLNRKDREKLNLNMSSIYCGI